MALETAVVGWLKNPFNWGTLGKVGYTSLTTLFAEDKYARSLIYDRGSGIGHDMMENAVQKDATRERREFRQKVVKLRESFRSGGMGSASRTNTTSLPRDPLFFLHITTARNRGCLLSCAAALFAQPIVHDRQSCG